MNGQNTSSLVFRLFGVAALVLGLSVGGLQPVGAQDASKYPASTESEGTSLLVDPPFVPISLVAPNCTYGGLIKSVVATTQYTVTFNLCRPDAGFISKLAIPAFGIYPQEWIEATSGETNRTTEGLEHPVGTGPYKVSSWDRGVNVTFVKNPDYWGPPPETNMLVFRWSDQPADRLSELQAETIDGFDAPAPEDYATIAADPNLALMVRHNLNTFYIGMTNTFTPFDDVRVRQAVAMGIDRQSIIDNYYPAGSELATHFTPCAIPNGCAGTDWYTFDLVAAKALLTAAGYPSGFPTHLYYRDVVRGYLPRPAEIAQEIHDQLLTNLGIDATVVEMESGAFIQAAQAGQLNGFHLLGWGVDYSHVSNFLDPHFGPNHAQFGNPFQEIYDELSAAIEIADPITAAPYYTDANNAIRELVPLVPVAHGSTAVAYLAEVVNPQASPLSMAEIFANSDPGGRNIFRWMQSAEPNSLFCADEWEDNSLRACAQVMESLYRYAQNEAVTEPALAETCIPNADSTIYVCTLRQNVKFHDGTGFDANDVVETFAMGLDVSSPFHKGNSNGWDYYNSLFGLMETAIHTISGNVGIGGATLKYVDAGNRSVVADANGNYSLMVSYGWSGVVTPSKSGYTFVPASRTYANVLSNKSAQNYSILRSLSYRSTGTNDGWILESTETSNAGGTIDSSATTLTLGDNAQDKQYRSILSFDTSGLPDTAVITKATLKIRQYGLPVGVNPFTTHGALRVDIRKPYFGTSIGLLINDFQAAVSKSAVGTFGATPVNSWYSAVLNATAHPFINLTGTTQFRLRFSLDDNDNMSADTMKFTSGNYATISARPTLIIEYYVP